MPLPDSVKADYFDFLRFPTVSADPARDQAMRDCASWLEKKFVQMGLESEIVATAGAPVVLAKWSKGGPEKRRKVLIYGHYDVQPAEMGDGWTGDPFEPRMGDGMGGARGILGLGPSRFRGDGRSGRGTGLGEGEPGAGGGDAFGKIFSPDVQRCHPKDQQGKEFHVQNR